MAALQYADVPGYAALILRKTFTDLSLPGAIMDRAFGWLNGRKDCDWNDQQHRWDFEGGAVLQFGYLAGARDRYRYQSAEFQYIAFDELTQFEIDEYMYLATRLRRLAGAKVPVRMRAASNPGGIGHEWVKARFIPKIERAPDGSAVRQRLMDGSPKPPFIPAKLRDNPNVDRDEYIKSLLMVDPTLRAQMLDGDWDAGTGGGKFKRHWWGRIDTAPKLIKRAAYVDLASTEETGTNDPDWTSMHWGGMTAEGRLVIEGALRMRSSPALVEAEIARQMALLNPEKPGAYALYVEQEPGSAGKTVVSNYARRILPGYSVHGHRPTGDKDTRADLLASMAERGDVLLVAGPWIEEFVAECANFIWDGNKNIGSAHDDQVDSGTGLATVLFRSSAAQSRQYVDGYREEIIRKGDLTLRGKRYIDVEPVRR